jgi:hypothetical protein
VSKQASCGLCKRETDPSRHHLMPQSIRRRMKKTKHGRAKLAELDEREDVTGTFCRDCHSKVHSLFPNGVLAKLYPTVELLKQAPGIPEWIKFISKQDTSKRFRNRESSTWGDRQP